MLLPHWFCDTDTPSLLQAILLLPPKVAHTSPHWTITAERSVLGDSLTHASNLPLFYSQHFSLLLFVLIFICISFFSPSALISLPYDRSCRASPHPLLYTGVGVIHRVTLTSRSAAGHHRYRSRCVESDCCTSLPSVKFVSSSYSVRREAIVFRLQVEVNVQTPKKQKKIHRVRCIRRKDTRQIDLEAPRHRVI